MSITDELREYAGNFYLFRYKDVREKLDAIADRIDAEHERICGEKWLMGYHECHAELMEGNEVIAKDLEKAGWVRGPLDADGEIWHSGDMSDSNWGVIEGIAYENGRWLVCGHDTSAPWIPADSIRHYHAPTVEDVLTDLCEHVWAAALLDGTWSDSPVESYIADFAKRLRLAKEDE